MDTYDQKLEQLEAKTINAVESAVMTDVPATNGNADWFPNTPKDQDQDWQQ
jgi:hypothetical protein